MSRFSIYDAAFLLLLSMLATSCATTGQEMSTKDGDHYKTSGFALFSKQDIQADANFVAYPNDSVREFQTGQGAAQDSTQALQTIMALGQLLGPLLKPAEPPSLSPLAPQPPTLMETIQQQVRDRVEQEIANRLGTK